MRSSPEFSLDEQFKNLEKVKVDKIITEIPQLDEHYQDKLKECIENFGEDDFLIVSTIDVLGENLNDILEILKQIDKHNIGIQILDMSSNVDIYNTIIQKIFRSQLIYILSWVEKRDKRYKHNIKHRQKLGIAKAKSKGKIGRPKKYSENAEDPTDREKYHMVVNMLKNEEHISKIAETTGLSRNTIYKIKKELNYHEK